MQRLLHYVSGVRLIVDPYDHRLWHFVIRGKRYDVQTRAGSYILRSDDGVMVGRFLDLSKAVQGAREHAHAAPTERFPIIAPRISGGRVSSPGKGATIE
ncbi:MAG: hypothetical protein ACYDAR_21980 [Thermomicrobiales bacterium]